MSYKKIIQLIVFITLFTICLNGKNGLLRKAKECNSPDNCLQYDESDQCEKCNESSVLNEGKCVKCSENCKECIYNPSSGNNGGDEENNARDVGSTEENNSPNDEDNSPNDRDNSSNYGDNSPNDGDNTQARRNRRIRILLGENTICKKCASEFKLNDKGKCEKDPANSIQ